MLKSTLTCSRAAQVVRKACGGVDCAVLKAVISPKVSLFFASMKTIYSILPHTDLGRSPSAFLTFTEGQATDTLEPPRAVGGLKEDAY